MANKKRDKNGYKKQLGRYRLNRSDILAIEKMLRVYADTREMRLAGVSAPPEGKKHMPRKYTDRNIKIGRYQPFKVEFGKDYFGWRRAGIEYIWDADSVKFLPKKFKKVRYLKVECHPGISVTFRPFRTEIYAQTHYATGKELKVMRETIASIETYLLSLSKSLVNTIKLGGAA